MLISKLRNNSAFAHMTDVGGGGWEGMNDEVSWEFDLRSKTVTVSSVATAAENKPVYSLPVHDIFA